MKIALVHDWLTGMRGGEKCLLHMCRQFPDAELSVLFHRPGSTTPEIEQRRLHASWLQKLPAVWNYYRWLLPAFPTAAGSVKVDPQADLVLSFSHAAAKSVRVPAGVPHICYCFTPMRYAWEMRDHYAPQSAGLRAAAKRIAWKTLAEPQLNRLKRWDHQTSSSVTHFVAISQTIQQRIERCYGRESEIVYPPVDTDFYTPAWSESREDFYLCVSAGVPYKRLDIAVEACKLAGKRLLVVGKGPQMAQLQRTAGSHCEFLGWRSDEEIRSLYRRCKALLFPGLEDFGIVPLEAQACGAAVIAYAAGGARETVIDGTLARPGSGLLVAEQSARAFADALHKFETKPGLVSSAVARNNALAFATDRFVHGLLDCIERVSGRTLPRRSPRNFSKAHAA